MSDKAGLLALSGPFVRIMRADRQERVLLPPREMDTGRYHAPGQPALYLSPTLEGARKAMSRYTVDGAERVAFRLEVVGAHVVDLRDEAMCERLGIDRELGNAPWQAALDAGLPPPSWQISDRARALSADGLIDRSRQQAGVWHLTLFRWNEPGAPEVKLVGGAEPVVF